MNERRPGGSMVRELTGQLAQYDWEYQREPTWQERAACAEVGSEAFFPEQGEMHLAQQAKRICAMCEVRAECLAEALANDEKYGVWGGTTPSERERMAA